MSEKAKTHVVYTPAQVAALSPAHRRQVAAALAPAFKWRYGGMTDRGGGRNVARVQLLSPDRIVVEYRYGYLTKTEARYRTLQVPRDPTKHVGIVEVQCSRSPFRVEMVDCRRPSLWGRLVGRKPTRQYRDDR